MSKYSLTVNPLLASPSILFFDFLGTNDFLVYFPFFVFSFILFHNSDLVQTPRRIDAIWCCNVLILLFYRRTSCFTIYRQFRIHLFSPSLLRTSSFVTLFEHFTFPFFFRNIHFKTFNVFFSVFLLSLIHI